MSIAESVAGKMKPKIQNGELDINALVNSTQTFANSVKDDNGNPLFDPNNNMSPFGMLTQLMNSMSGGNNPQMNEEQMMAQANSMLQTMGMGDINTIMNQQVPKKNTGKKKKKGGNRK